MACTMKVGASLALWGEFAAHRYAVPIANGFEIGAMYTLLGA